MDGFLVHERLVRQFFLRQLDNAHPIEQLDGLVGRVNLVPFEREVGPVAVGVVVVVETFAHHQEVNRHEVARGVADLESDVADLVRKPVDDGPVDRRHQVVNRQEQKPNPRRREGDVKQRVRRAPGQPRHPVRGEVVKRLPIGNVLGEFRVHRYRPFADGMVKRVRFPHHVNDAFAVHRRMRVVLGVGVGVVHPVHDPVGVGTQVIGTLENEREYEENLLPRLGHGKRPVCGVPVQEECLEEQ